MNVSVNLSKNARQIQSEVQNEAVYKKPSFLSRIFELSVSSLLRKCRKSAITVDDLPSLEDDDYLANFMKGYKWKKRVTVSLIMKFWKSFVVAFVFRLAAIFADYASILLLKYLIDAAEVSAPLFTFFVISVLILFFMQLKSILFGAHTYFVGEDSALMCAVLNNLIIKKALNLTAGENEWTNARIAKLVTTHSEAIANSLLFVHHSWATIVELTIALLWIWETLSHRTIITVLVVAIVYLVLNILDSFIYKRYLKRQMDLRDRRVEHGKEFLNSIETIKVFAWEDEFKKKLQVFRKDELDSFRNTSWINGIMHSLNITSPFIVMFVSFAVYGLSFEIEALRFEDAFVLIAVFNYMSRPLYTVMPSIDFLNKAFHSATRINQFLLARQSPNQYAKRAPTQATEADYDVKLESASFSWHGSSVDLKDISLEVKKGEFHSIVGFPLCGKSSLLCAIIGELTLTKGKRWVSSNISFAPSNPFIFTQTVKANILFGNQFDKAKYDAVINVCDLRKDIFNFPRCDATIIGENGYVITDTQKAQISIARCLYEDADIYALDKAFAPMDRITAKKIFDKLFGPKGYLKEKTVIFATNNIRFTKTSTMIHVMNDGKIENSGTFEELVEESEILKNLLEQSEVDERLDEKNLNEKPRRKTVMFDVEKMSLKKKKPAKVQEEATVIKKRNTYLYYFRCCSIPLFILYFVFLIVRFVLHAFTFFWLSFWLDPSWKKVECPDCPQYVFLQMLSFFAVAAVVSNALAYMFSILTNVEASRRIYKNIVDAMFSAPMHFFTTANVQEIERLFTSDLDIVDTHFPMYLRSFLDTSLHILMVFAIVSINLPFFLIFVVGFVVFFFAILKFYFPTSHKIIHLETQNRATFLCSVTQNFDSRMMVRVFGKAKAATSEIESHADVLTRCRFAHLSAFRWLSLRLELVSNLVIFSCFIVASLTRYFDLVANAHFALSVAVILSLTELVSTCLRVICTLESYAPNIQKICHSKNFPKENLNNILAVRDSWPDDGGIEIENLNVFVNKGKHILKDISISVGGQEKLGVIGKPGSGKTQLALSLIAMTSADDESRVFIDGVSVYDIPTKILRSRVTVIPQKAKIFNDTLRNNLDPCEQFADSDIWLAIESCQMKEFVKNLSHGINQLISPDLISEDQKEQINVCRALLKGGQIFVIDQSTQFMKEPTKELVEEAIRESLKQSTTITIGDNFEDVEHCDKVVVIENGVVVNIDTPENLISKYGTLQEYLLVRPV
ncbi:unnamed protein product [Caenorhabditis bovis]|uniref:Uncharacterized protein n=1 Tax=Caenorhabditis bovis TaxID=2654633 RepID=A0A8S1ECG1_9PELO|nr:unnamed protein product [Caenorhabditis bovis]